MTLGRKPTYALLAALITFNILLRYPQGEHESGIDSFFIHALTNAILDNGYAEWILNPLSYFGWYPLSYPSAGPFYLASMSSMTALNVEGSILLTSLALGPIGILGAFVMAREFRGDGMTALAVAFLYGLAPRFLAFTLWSASTRNLFMALLPLLIWTLLRTYRRGSAKHSALMVTSLVILAATHRLVVLAFIVLLAFLVAVILQVAIRILRVRFPKIVLRNSVRRATPHVALGLVVAIAIATLLGTNVLGEYSEGELFSGEDVHVQLLNLAVNIARAGGLAVALSLVGLVVITRQRSKTITEPFLAMTLIGLIPTLFLRQYTGFYILPFIAIFGGLGMVGVLRALGSRRRIVKVVAVALVIGVAGFSTVVLNLEIDRSSTISGETYSTGLFMKVLRAPGTLVANEGLTGIRISAISGAKVLPVGGAGTTFQSPELLAYGFYAPEEVYRQIVQVGLADLTIESDSLWIALGIQAELDWVRIVESPVGGAPARLGMRYSPTYYLELVAAPGKYLAYGNSYCSNLGLSVHDFAYKIYEDGTHSLWWLHSPGITPQTEAVARRCP